MLFCKTHKILHLYLLITHKLVMMSQKQNNTYSVCKIIAVDVICSLSLMSDVWDASSSVPLVIPAFLKPFLKDETFTAFQACTTQLQTLAWVALLIFPVSVKVWIPSDIHFSHSSWTWFLKEWFTEMSNGCNFFVRPLGITAVVVLCSVL